ncbi:MAG TPA: ABC transporter substrate-binding protein [Candidatus Limnocylindria bacterium]|jgi:ABC-type transport system substrate-binding protein|nr:ABC transporter substrate-binding protein [Candidatus Limnocylindria bacterium]
MSRAPIALVALVLLLSSCRDGPLAATPTPTPAQGGGTLRVALPAEITTLDPWAADAASVVATRQIFDTLLGIDPVSSSAVPGLAVSWQGSNDGATWTLKLRDGIRFHDGEPFDAAAVVASFERGRSTLSYRTLFDEPSLIARVQAVDVRTVRFDLRAPFGPFLARLASPQTAISRGTSGTGAFVAAAEALAPDGTLTLRRSDSYWRRDAAGKQLPLLDGLALRPVQDAASRLAELRAGRADVALDLPVAQASAARSDPSLTLLVRREAVLASLGIDPTEAPFDRPEVRRAVSMTVGVPSALDAVYAGFIRRASQVVPAGTLGYDDTVSPQSLDVSAAKKILSDARIPTPVSADLAYPSLPTGAYPDPQRIAQSIAADLGNIGIVARLRAVDPHALRDGTATFTLDTTPVGLDPDDIFWPLFGSDDPASGSLVVGLLRKARAEADPTKRAELYKQVSKIARTDALRVPLLFADRISVATARLAGHTPGQGIESFGTVWLRP